MHPSQWPSVSDCWSRGLSGNGTMSMSKIALGLVAAFFAAASLVSLIWGGAVWLSTWLEPVAVPFVLAGVLAFVALLSYLIAMALRPAAATQAGLAGSAASLFSAGPTPAEIEALADVCTRSPWTGLGASFVLGLVQGLGTPARHR